MKISLTVISAIFIVLLISSCKKEPYSDEYDRSYNAWLKFKSESQNSYNYSLTAGSFTGSSIETIIYVQNGKVVRRSFKRTQQNRTSPPTYTITEQWTEEGATLNTHTGASPTLTFDEIYAEARNNWLKKRDKVTTFFENKNDGMLSLAGYVPDGCWDDCFVGVRIGFIAKIQF